MKNNRDRPPFWAWQDEGEIPVLAISGTIDTGTSWYEDAVTPRAFREALDAYAGRDILVSINSPGGDVFAGFEIYNMLAHRQGKTTVRVIGEAASAASYIAMAASPGCLEMCEASMMMIHSPWTYAAGNAQEMRAQAEILDEIEDIMCAAYMHRFTGSEEELHAMLVKTRYMSPTEAKACGLCDRIVVPFEQAEDEPQIAAMAQRYAAMSMAQIGEIRVRMGVPPRAKTLDASGKQDTNDYLALADAAIAGML